MAITDLRAESALHNHPLSSPPPAAVMRVLSRYDRPRLEAFVSVAIDLMDLMDGEPDFEFGGEDEPQRADGDTQDLAYAEWSSLRGNQRGGVCRVSEHEDDEEDDVGEDSYDHEDIDEREGVTDDEPNMAAPIWPGEGRA